MDALGTEHPLHQAILDEVATLSPYQPDISRSTQYSPSQLPSAFHCGAYTVALNASDGSIAQLGNDVLGIRATGVLGGLQYQTYSAEEYFAFMESYNYLSKRGIHTHAHK